MFLLINHNGKLVEDDNFDRLTFETAQAAQTWADEQRENGTQDWMVVKFVCFT